MIVRTLLLSMLAIGATAASAKGKPAHTRATAAPAKSVMLKQGEVGRWPGLAARRCALDGKAYPAVDSVCYFPIDIEAKAGRHPIAVWDQDGRQHKGTAIVEVVDWPTLQVTLPNDTYINVSPDNERRATKERAAVLKLFRGTPADARFSLPLGAPATPLPRNEDDFGSLRTFNAEVESQHTGRDYPVAEGSAVKAVADGTVVLAEEHFMTGKSVFIDHGDGMVSMNFHLSDIEVEPGDEVKRGQEIGKVGATGRTSGPHLHLGIRWIGARIDPQPLLDSPLTLHEVGDTPVESEHKEVRTAEPKEPVKAKPRRRSDEG
jgi:murein DD-endopeptidase MepM/ murein hydrolase activator NlpD